MSDSPKLGKITRTRGIAGQFSLSVVVTHEGESPELVTFVGNVDGGPIVWVGEMGHQMFISRAVTDRIGSELTPEWVRKYFAPRDQS